MARNGRPQSRAGLAVPPYPHLGKRQLFRMHMRSPFLLAVCWLPIRRFRDRRGKGKDQAKDNPAVFSFCAKYPMSYSMIHLLANGDTTVNFCAAMDDRLSSLSCRDPMC